METKWISVKDELPKKDIVGAKVLIHRIVNDSQKLLSISIYDTLMVKHCEEETHWMPLPKPPKQRE